ncbi:unnamed protein product [Bursaphelenchus okinawaensis]|uniref:Fumarylacetoacetase n=1 Tax=Bursaphelenchus okinawaensis TaxID=465554 RepID=A0A811LQ13_9BILA|nr:unnamed protein product [Bursaphelenchus okinawaensis]CAG9127739.1 unnamed protein product [Bursaphelenchus okinawaensis]
MPIAAYKYGERHHEGIRHGDKHSDSYRHSELIKNCDKHSESKHGDRNSESSRHFDKNSEKVLEKHVELSKDQKDHHHGAASVRSTEESESTSRSATSTPVQRNLQLNVNYTPLSPTSAAAVRCNICEVNYDSGAHLQVHYLADHCAKKDGTDFKCLHANCDQYFSTKQTLKNHLYSHFSAMGSMNARSDSRDRTPERPHKRSMNGTPDSLIGIADWRQSKKIKLEEPPKTSMAEPSISCHLCQQHFSDTVLLQKHWVEQHLSQLDARPHVCQRCDAGFTTIDALRSHAATHN